jgi:hypothetical protein
MIPLVLKVPDSCGEGCTGILADFWSEWATLLGFLVMIKPVRESSRLFMLQFNSLDRQVTCSICVSMPPLFVMHDSHIKLRLYHPRTPCLLIAGLYFRPTLAFNLAGCYLAAQTI